MWFYGSYMNMDLGNLLIFSSIFGYIIALLWKRCAYIKENFSSKRTLFWVSLLVFTYNDFFGITFFDLESFLIKSINFFINLIPNIFFFIISVTWSIILNIKILFCTIYKITRVIFSAIFFSIKFLTLFLESSFKEIYTFFVNSELIDLRLFLWKLNDFFIWSYLFLLWSLLFVYLFYYFKGNNYVDIPYHRLPEKNWKNTPKWWNVIFICYLVITVSIGIGYLVYASIYNSSILEEQTKEKEYGTFFWQLILDEMVQHSIIFYIFIYTLRFLCKDIIIMKLSFKKRLVIDPNLAARLFLNYFIVVQFLVLVFILYLSIYLISHLIVIFCSLILTNNFVKETIKISVNMKKTWDSNNPPILESLWYWTLNMPVFILGSFLFFIRLFISWIFHGGHFELFIFFLQVLICIYYVCSFIKKIHYFIEHEMNLRNSLIVTLNYYKDRHTW